MIEYCLANTNFIFSIFICCEDSVFIGTDTVCHVGTQGFLAYVEVIITKMFCYIVLYQLLSFFDNVKV
jgi:hypothetical protein